MKNAIVPHILIVSVLLITGLILWFLFSYLWVTDEQTILRILQKSRIQLEKGSVYHFANLLSADYVDKRGMDKQEVLGLLQELFKKTQNREFYFNNISVQMQGEEAAVNLDVLFRAKNKEEYPLVQRFVSSDDYHPMRIQIFFRKIARQWQIVYTGPN